MNIFEDPTTCLRIVAEIEEAMSARFGGAAGVFLPATRRELADVMREMGVGAGEAVVRLLETDNQGAILRFGSEADPIKILWHPTTRGPLRGLFARWGGDDLGSV